MPRCAVGNHFSEKEGDTRCKACLNSQPKHVQPKSVTPHLKRIPFPRVEENTHSVDEAYFRLETQKLPTVEGERSEHLTMEEALTWYELSAPSFPVNPNGGAYGAPLPACFPHTAFEENKTLSTIFQGFHITDTNELDQFLTTVNQHACLCRAYPNMPQLLQIMMERGQISSHLIEEYLLNTTPSSKNMDSELLNEITLAYLLTSEVSEQFLTQTFNKLTILQPQDRNPSSYEVQVEILKNILKNPTTSKKILKQFVRQYVRWCAKSERSHFITSYDVRYLPGSLQEHPQGAYFLKKCAKKIKWAIRRQTIRGYLLTAVNFFSVTLYEKFFDPKGKKINETLNRRKDLRYLYGILR